MLIRLSRGSGLTGLGVDAAAVRTAGGAPSLRLVRPLLGIPKARLIATLKAAKIPYADDPSNRDPRFTRARLARADAGARARRARRRRGWRCWRSPARGRPTRWRPRPNALPTRCPLRPPARPRIALRAGAFCRAAGRVRAASARPRHRPGRRRRAGRARQARGAHMRAGCGASAPKRALSPHPGRRAGHACRRDHRGRTGPATAFETTLTTRRAGAAGRGKNALEYAEFGAFRRPACAAYIGQSLRREFATNAVARLDYRSRGASARGLGTTWDERQSPQFRPLGHHRSAAARAVHAVPESRPAHHLAGHLVLAAAERGRSGPRARRR